MEYNVLIVEGGTIETVKSDLEKQVNKYIQNNWKPLGGISVSVKRTGYYHCYTFAQAMIKE